MLGLRQLLPSHLQLNLCGWAAVEQACASSLPALTLWSSQLQQACSVANTAKTPPSLHERRVANLKFCQKRAAWRRQVKELRKQWLQEHLDRVAAHKASAELVKQQAAQLRELRDVSKQMDRQKHKLERDIREAERAVEVAGMRLASAYRQDMRLQTIATHKEARRAELLESSRSWIAPEALTARITAALDNPADL